MATIERLYRVVLEQAAILDRLTPEELDDIYRLYAAVYALQVQAQALIDMAMRAAALLGLAPEGYVDAGAKLRAAGLLTDDEYRTYRSVVGFRNVAVHRYAHVDPQAIVEVIRRREYRKAVEIAAKIHKGLRDRGLDP